MKIKNIKTIVLSVFVSMIFVNIGSAAVYENPQPPNVLNGERFNSSGFFINQGNGTNLTTEYLSNMGNMTSIINFNASNATLPQVAKAVQQEAIAHQFELRMLKAIYMILKSIFGLA